MEFLTSHAVIEQTDEPGIFQTELNQLFRDQDGSIYLVPRNYRTDNYTIPDWIAWLGGNKSKWDVRPSHFHDLGCEFHALIRVKLTEQQLRSKRILHAVGSRIVCEDIPVSKLEIVPCGKWAVDCLFKRMMIATYDIPAWRVQLMRGAVGMFNFGWWLEKVVPIDMAKMYTGINKPETADLQCSCEGVV